MKKASVKIIGWRENNIGYTGWDSHANVELKRRLARSIDNSSQEVKKIAKAVKAKRCLVIHGVDENQVENVTQILHTMGAELEIELAK